MTEKERLTEIINEVARSCGGLTVDALADYLLANGVIVLPCGRGEILPYNGIEYKVDHWNILASAFTDKEGVSKLHIFKVEEAYKALAERSEG